MDYPKMIVALIGHFGEMEGTDYLGEQGRGVAEGDFPTLTEAERAELTKLRDIARTEIGWSGYGQQLNEK